jgi:peptidyl-prolyl cis-trans isomerase SurA
MLTSFKAALCALLLIPSLLLSLPALADSTGATQTKPAKAEEKGLLDKLKFWGDDEKPESSPAPAEAEAAPVAAPQKEEKGLLDKLKFWGDDEKETPQPAPKAAPAVKPKPASGSVPVVKTKPEPGSKAVPVAKPETKPVPAKTEVAKPQASPTAPAEVTQVDRIIAVVDNSVITRGELLDRMKTVLGQLEKQGTPLPPEDVLQKQLLERLITDQLQLQLATQTGLRVDDNQLDKTMERIAEQNKLSLTEFRTALERDGIRYGKFREDIRREIIMARLREREVDNRITITDAEIDNLLTNQSSRKDSDEFEIAHILIRAPQEGAPEELQKLRAKAEEALKKLQAGTDFGQVSASYSDAPNALEGGKLGWKTATQLPELFLEAARALKAGEITPILRSPNGFHILKLLDRRGGSSPLVVQQTHARHILIKPSEVLSESDAQHHMDDLKERLDNGADFAELARLHSEDGSASKGGDLGWASPGDMVPEFEKAMNELKPGEISAPVRSPFGWHVIQVIERRSQDMSREASRIKARQEIKARKSDEAYQDWLRELRDRAFVEYHLEDKD